MIGKLQQRRVCGRVRSALAMMQASRASLLASPACKSASAAISGHQPPTRPGDNTPDHGRLGARILPGLAGRSQDSWDAKKITRRSSLGGGHPSVAHRRSSRAPHRSCSKEIDGRSRSNGLEALRSPLLVALAAYAIARTDLSYAKIAALLSATRRRTSRDYAPQILAECSADAGYDPFAGK